MNEQLRNYVQSTAFSLSLTRRQVDCLIGLDWLIRNKATRWHGLPGQPPLPVDVPQLHQLIRRGLIVHHMPEDWYEERPHPERPISAFYTVTRAGHLVLGLLHEAGMIEVAPLPELVGHG